MWVTIDLTFLCVVLISMSQSWQALDTYHASLSVMCMHAIVNPLQMKGTVHNFMKVVHSTAAKQENIEQGTAQLHCFRLRTFKTLRKCFLLVANAGFGINWIR